MGAEPEGVEGQGMREEAAAGDRSTERRRRRGRTRPSFTAVVVAVVVAVAVAALVVVAGDEGPTPEPVAPEPPAGDPPGERAGETPDWSEELAHIDVTAEEFRHDWNRLVDDLGFGHELEPLTLPERPHGMGAETRPFPDGAELEVIAHPEGFLSRMELRGEPADVDEAVDYLAMVYALIHATSGLDDDEVRAFAADELGLDETVADTDRTARARLNGVAYEFDTFQGQWRLWAGSADDAP